MTEAEFTAPRRSGRDAGVFGKLRAWIEGEDLPPGEVEHDYCAGRVRVVAAVLGCYHTGRLEAERSVERECAIEVGNGEGYYINARFHQSLMIYHSENGLLPSFPATIDNRLNLSLQQSGKLGEMTQAQISVAHGYRGIALIRKFLNLGYANAAIQAFEFKSPLIAGPDRQGPLLVFAEALRVHDEFFPDC